MRIPSLTLSAHIRNISTPLNTVVVFKYPYFTRVKALPHTHAVTKYRIIILL